MSHGRMKGVRDSFLVRGSRSEPETGAAGTNGHAPSKCHLFPSLRVYFSPNPLAGFILVIQNWPCFHPAASARTLLHSPQIFLPCCFDPNAAPFLLLDSSFTKVRLPTWSHCSLDSARHDSSNLRSRPASKGTSKQCASFLFSP